MTTRQDDTAFPVFQQVGSLSNTTGGLTKREYFAACVLTGLISLPCEQTFEDAVKYSVISADLLIEELDK